MRAEAERLLKAADCVMIIDWPSRDVPETLARAGYTVLVKGGPEADNYWAHEVRDGEVVRRRTGHRPEHVDIVYAHRPLQELPQILAMAAELDAKALWWQSGMTSTGVKDPTGCWVPEESSRKVRATVEAAGLAYVDDAYIADAVRQLGIRR